jgi:catechol 2,3-dioxygenase-like lactoylglutathione lyase family enzyme
LVISIRKEESTFLSLLSVRKVVETCLYAEDLKRSELFYRDILGLDFVSREEGRHVFLKAGSSMLLVFNANATLNDKSLPSHGIHGNSTIHVGFEIRPADYKKWKEWLEFKNVKIEKEVAWPDGGQSIYFRDPDRNAVELITSGVWPVF